MKVCIPFYKDLMFVPNEFFTFVRVQLVMTVHVNLPNASSAHRCPRKLRSDSESRKRHIRVVKLAPLDLVQMNNLC